MTCGLPIDSSYPSRRIVSISTPRCNSPRPETAKLSLPAIGSTRRATFRSSSRSRRSRRWRLVTYLPLRPASGELLTQNTICSVGSSTATRGMARRFSASLIVSPISTSARPTTATISPAVGLFDFGAAELVENVDRGDFGRHDSIVGLHQGHGLPAAERARLDPADRDPADVVGPIERGDQHLQRRFGIDFRAGNSLQHQSSSGCIESSVLGRIVRGIAVAAAGEDVGEIGQRRRRPPAR